MKTVIIKSNEHKTLRYEIWLRRPHPVVKYLITILAASQMWISDESMQFTLKAGFHMIADDRGSQNVLRSSGIIWKHTSAIVCDPAITSQTIADDRPMFYLLRLTGIVL